MTATLDQLNSRWEQLEADNGAAHTAERAAWARYMTHEARARLEGPSAEHTKLLSALANATGNAVTPAYLALRDFEQNEKANRQGALLADFEAWTAAQDRFDETQQAMADERQYWRQVGEAVPLGSEGSRDPQRPVKVVNNDGSVPS